MSALEEIVLELRALYKEGLAFLTERENKGKEITLLELTLKFESWYTRAQSAVAQVIPERLEDFRQAYKLDRRKEIDVSTYTISDYLSGISVSRGETPLFDTKNVFLTLVLRLLSILKAALDTAPSKLRDIRTLLRAEILDSDIASARDLLKAQHLRSAGVVCGVAVESHLKSVASRRGVTFRKQRPTLSDYNDALRDKS